MTIMNLVGLLMIFIGIMLSGMGGSLMHDAPGLGLIIIFFGVGIAATGGYLAVS